MTEPKPPTLTDAGNAQRFAEQHGPDVRYCYMQRRWYVWVGSHWQQDQGDRIVRLAKETARDLYAEAAHELNDTARKALVAWAKQSESATRINAMLYLAQSEPGIPVTLDDLDRDLYLLNCRNGTLDLRTGLLKAHDRSDLLTRCLAIDYDPEAACPQFLAFLDRILNGKADVIAFVQRVLGYCCTGSTEEQILVVAWGSGSNGKTTLLRIVTDTLGPYACWAQPETFLAKDRNDTTIRNDIARLHGARLVVATEPEKGRRLAEAQVKQMTGGDKVPARFLYQETFEYTPSFKIILGTNHRPNIHETTHAIWRRVKLVPFTVTIPDAEQDRGLRTKLQAEGSGLLAWLVRGCLDWQAHGLGEPEDVIVATAQYREDQDLLGDFLGDECVVAPDATITARALHQAYLAWAEAQHIKHPLTEKAFSERIEEHGYEKKKTNRAKVFHGLRRRELTDTEPDWVTEEPS